MLATVQSGALVGVEAVPVQVEVNTGESGEPRLVLVGLPDSAVRESVDRVYSALTNSGFRVPRTRTTVNLAPGDLRKEGPLYDLPLALGLCGATDQLERGPFGQFLIAGELALSGEIRPVRGGLALGALARTLGTPNLLLPAATAREAALVEGINVYAAGSLIEAHAFLSGAKPLEPVRSPLSDLIVQGRNGQAVGAHAVDFSEVKGQQGVRRAVEVAVAGGHNLLVLGPPGSGKSMIAQRIPTIMPDPALEEFLDILRIRSAAGETLREGLNFERPFRSPHHTVSEVALVGGGLQPRPGEISLAHHGVLFLDELPEFKRGVLEVLRQPLEDGAVRISRSAAKVRFPASFMLVAAMNPCPCGFYGDSQHECRCTPPMIQRYRARLSGPLLDRIDIHVEAPALSISELRSAQPAEGSETIRNRVTDARLRQAARFEGQNIACNARMSHKMIRQHCSISRSQGDLMQQAMEQLSLSARAYDRILKVARTIADLAGSDPIENHHLLEAIQYRSLDRSVMY